MTISWNHLHTHAKAFLHARDTERLTQPVGAGAIEGPQHDDDVDVRGRAQGALGGAPEEDHGPEVGAEGLARGLHEVVKDAAHGAGEIPDRRGHGFGHGCSLQSP